MKRAAPDRSRARRSRSGSQKLGLVLASVGVALGLFALLEFLLRAAGIGDAGAHGGSRLPYQRLVQPVLEPGQLADGTDVLTPADPRLPYQWVRREKPADGLRVIVFGGSATAGLGYSPNVTFARHLERLLRRAVPERSVEVLNLGITALSSNQVKELVREACARYAPDAIVVYSGNNEFLELHAQKYVQAHAGWSQRLRTMLRETNLVRLLQGRREVTTMAQLQAGESAMQLTQSEIIEDIALTEDELEAVVDRYADNLREIVDIASASSTPLVLMTVASNWEWRGKEDLPATWKDELLEGREADDVNVALLGALEERLADTDDPLRYEWLFRRATLRRELGRFEQARDDYREAMNVDPHLRRALDVMNARVLDLPVETPSALFDTVAFLETQAQHGTIGFEHFYDYVHFTPAGACLVGAAVLGKVTTMLDIDVEDGLIESYLDEELARLATLTEDDIDARRWLGLGLDRARVDDRDLWKYETMLAELDDTLERDPQHARALIYRGNARSFRPGHAAAALSDWQQALAQKLDDDEAALVRANIERLEREREVSR